VTTNATSAKAPNAVIILLRQLILHVQLMIWYLTLAINPLQCTGL